MDVIELIESLPISKGVSYQQLKRVSKFCIVLSYDKGDVLFSKSVDFKYIGLIISGKVDYYISDFLNHKNIHLGSFKKYPVGLFNFSEQKEEDYLIKATEPTQILAINYHELKEMEEDIPYFTSALYKSIIKLQVSIQKRILNIILKFVPKI